MSRQPTIRLDRKIPMERFSEITGASHEVLKICALEQVLLADKRGPEPLFSGHATQFLAEKPAVRNSFHNGLMSRRNITDLSDEDAILYHGLLVDTSGFEHCCAGIEHAIKVGKEIISRKPSSIDLCLVNYQQANAFHAKTIWRAGTDSPWIWQDRDRDNELICLRKVVSSESFDCLNSELRCKTLTNLANTLDFIGRMSEALEQWDRALLIDPEFAMAQGNRGLGLLCYAKSLYDDGHALALLKESYHSLDSAQNWSLMPDVERQFEGYKSEIRSYVTPEFLSTKFDMSQPIEGSPEEIQYRQWVLSRRLFLNPLNDLGYHTIAAYDALNPPPIAIRISDGIGLLALYNQIKQEYVSARYLAYLGLCQAKGAPHFSDKEVHLFNNEDFACYGLSIELTKAAFRVAYSTFDRIAFFLNEYFLLAMEPRKMSFKTLWFEPNVKERRLRDRFANTTNWPLRGLYFLSRDLHEIGSDLTDVLEPDAKDLLDIRNCLEHRHLKIVEGIYHTTMDPTDAAETFHADRISKIVTRSDFEKKTVRLLKLVRAAITYLSLSVYAEELNRANNRGSSEKVAKISKTFIADELKI